MNQTVKTHYVDFGTDRELDLIESDDKQWLHYCLCNLKSNKIHFNQNDFI